MIKYSLTVLLLYGAYTETGIWTTVNLALILIGFEVVGFNQKYMAKALGLIPEDYE